MTRAVGEDVRARLRLVPSDGEIQCPKKGQLAIGRCLELQHELLCTCPTYLAYAGPDPEQLRIPDMSAAAQAAEEDDEMSQKNGGTARVLAALRRTPDKVFLPDEIAKIKGGSRNAVHPMMIRLVRGGMAVRAGGGYKAGPRLLGETEAAPVAVEVVRKPQPPDRAAKAPPPPEDDGEDEHDEDDEPMAAGPDRPALAPEAPAIEEAHTPERPAATSLRPFVDAPPPGSRWGLPHKHEPLTVPLPPGPCPGFEPQPECPAICKTCWSRKDEHAPLLPADEPPAPPIDTARAVASLRWALDGVAAGFIDLGDFQRHLERVKSSR